MLLSVALALAGTYSDDFSTDSGAWSGATVVDGVLQITDGTASFPAMAYPASFTLTARIRMTTSGEVTLASGSSALTLDYVGPGGISFGAEVWPLPPAHLAWTPDADPVIEPGADFWDGGNTLHCDVYKDDDTGIWYLYWTGEMAEGYPYRQIGVATSYDGVTWTEYAGNPVLTIDYSADIDGVHVHMPSIARSTDGYWHMFYSCYQNNVGNRICHASSPDGLAWSPQGIAVDRGADGEFDSASTRMPDVLVLDDGTWHMWYDGTKGEEHYGPTGYARSPDGWTWTKQGEILPFEEALQGLSVWRSPWGLESFHNKDDYFTHAHAAASDPATWTTTGAILTKGWAWWNDGYIQAPSVWVDGTTWHMWYNAYTYSDHAEGNAHERLGHAQGEATPGQWFDLQLEGDGTVLKLSLDGASSYWSGADIGAITLAAVGTAELDDVVLEWEDAVTDSGDTGDTGGDDTGEGDTGESDTGNGEPEDTSTGVTQPYEEPCGCAAPVGAGAWLGLAALLGVRRRSSR